LHEYRAVGKKLRNVTFTERIGNSESRILILFYMHDVS